MVNKVQIRKNLSKQQLRFFLLVLFLVIATPATVLSVRAYDQLKWESFYRYRMIAEEVAARIDQQWIQYIAKEEQRSFADYRFLIVANGLNSRSADGESFLQLSPLAQYPVESAIPGLLGYFEVDSEGVFSSPLLPRDINAVERYGLNTQDVVNRQALEQKLWQILSQNRLVQRRKAKTTDKLPKSAAPPAPSRSVGLSEYSLNSRADTSHSNTVNGANSSNATKQKTPGAEPSASIATAFDRLKKEKSSLSKRVPTTSYQKIEGLKLDESLQEKALETEQRQRSLSKKPTKQVADLSRAKRRKQIELAQEVDDDAVSTASEPQLRVKTFSGEIDPFEMSLLDERHFVLFRKVWRDGQRYIQGAIVDKQHFIASLIEAEFAASILFQMSDVIVAYQGELMTTLSGKSAYITATDSPLTNVLYQVGLSAPVSDMSLIFTVNQLPAGPGGIVVIGAAVILLTLLLGGFLFIYWVGKRQIALNNQQQDFVSAVSHELKTPLTSIRMYGEMLRQGWVSEAKKIEYYDFIFYESERLSRLINNVLQLARVTRNKAPLAMKSVLIKEVVDMVRSKVSSQVECAAFSFVVNVDDQIQEQSICIDDDSFIQVIINLIDNALKFSADASCKEVHFSVVLDKKQAVFIVRDFGPGIDNKQINKIFQLFYRTGDELTRETVGTGIGLALVKELTSAMGGEIKVVNRNPGAEFAIVLPLVSGGKSVA